MWVFSRACSSGRTLQPNPSSAEYQQRLRDKSIKHPPPGKQAKGSSSNQVLQNSRCSDSNIQAGDEDPKAQVLHRPAASECPPGAAPSRRGPEATPDEAHPSCLHPRPPPLQERERTREASGSTAPSRARGPSQLPVLGSSAQLEVLHRAGEEDASTKASPGEARCPLMSMNHRHALKIPVNEMSNTHHTKPQPPGPAEESTHLPAEPSPLSPDSTLHIYGKGGERKEYIFRGLYNSSFAHQRLSFPSPPSLRDGSYFLHPRTAVPPPFPTKEKGSPTQMHLRPRAQDNPATTQRSPHPHKLPLDTTAV